MKVGDTVVFTGDDSCLADRFRPSTGRECEIISMGPIRENGTFSVVVKIGGDVQWTTSKYLE
jgi:hypothetical protein